MNKDYKKEIEKLYEKYNISPNSFFEKINLDNINFNNLVLENLMEIEREKKKNNKFKKAKEHFDSFLSKEHTEAFEFIHNILLIGLLEEIGSINDLVSLYLSVDKMPFNRMFSSSVFSNEEFFRSELDEFFKKYDVKDNRDNITKQLIIDLSVNQNRRYFLTLFTPVYGLQRICDLIIEILNSDDFDNDIEIIYNYLNNYNIIFLKNEYGIITNFVDGEEE